MACMLFLQSLQKLNQRLFTSTYRRYLLLLNAKGRKKSRSEKKVWTKQLIEESDDDEVISNIRGNNFTDSLSEPDDEMETGSINDNFRNVFYFAARINLNTSTGTSCFCFIELATFWSLTQYPFQMFLSPKFITGDIFFIN